MIHLSFFLSPGMKKPLELPNNIIFYIRQRKKIFGALIQEKIIIPALFHSKVFVLLGGLGSGFACQLRGLQTYFS